MKKFLLITMIGNFVIGAAILIYDAHFFYLYNADVNEVAAVVNGGIADWPTGERPLYTILPAWIFGSFFWLISFALFVWLYFLCKRKTS